MYWAKIIGLREIKCIFVCKPNCYMLEHLKSFYASGATRTVAFRRKALADLAGVVEQYKDRIAAALYKDLGKSARESYLTEIALVLGEIRYQQRHLKRWSRPRRVAGPLALFPSRSRMVREPYGVVLVVAPWNYPFQLLMMPLVGAIAAGNCVVAKPAETTPTVAALLEEMLGSCFPQTYVRVLRTGHEGLEQVLEQGPDYLFFTGSPQTGSRLMELAARNWVPVTLELGGKSPCVVTAQADLRIAARRILWGKMLNAGQTCVAPDHVWVEDSVRDAFVEACRQEMVVLSGNLQGDFGKSSHYARIVTVRHWQRLVGLLEGAQVLAGGGFREEDRFFAPTLVQVSRHHPLMQEEIFGPILPIMGYHDDEQLIAQFNSKPVPLALYYFGNKRQGREFLARVPSGGACINDAVLHLVNRNLPFGGQGKSGMGAYHGRYSVETFSRLRSVLESPTWMDLKVKYPPYRIVATVFRKYLGL